MKDYILWLSAPLALLLVGVGGALPTWKERKIQQREAERRTHLAQQIKYRFQSIRAIKGKVFMAPAPPHKGLSVKDDLYTMSLPHNDYWYKPKRVGIGFQFGFFSGAKYYDYKIIKIESDGITVLYNASAVDHNTPLHLAWK